jgi:hypothetical protein
LKWGFQRIDHLLTAFGLWMPTIQPKVYHIIKGGIGFAVAVEMALPLGPATPIIQTAESDTPALTAFPICPWVRKPKPNLDRGFATFARVSGVSAMPKGLTSTSSRRVPDNGRDEMATPERWRLQSEQVAGRWTADGGRRKGLCHCVDWFVFLP